LRHSHAVYVGAAGDPRFGEEPASGQITLDAYRLHFESEGVRLDFPLVRLEIEADRSGEEPIVFTDPTQPGLWVSTYASEILRDPALRRQAKTRGQLEAFESYGELKRRLRVCLWCMGVFAVLALAGWLALGLAVRSLVARIPPEMEQELGDEALKEFQQEAMFVDDPKLKAKLDEAAAPLLAVLPKTTNGYKFYLEASPLPNAFALPGGHVVVTTSLIELADRPEQITGVLAHEIAHVTQKHAFREAMASIGPFLLFRVFGSDVKGLLGAAGDASDLLVQQGFSQKYELEADRVGWDYLVAAHVDPRGMIEMLRKLDAEERRLAKLDVQFAAFSSHPRTEKRIRILEKRWKKEKRNRGP